MHNFVYLNSLLECGGYGFGEEEAWRVQCSLKRFLQSQPKGYWAQVRFWGKILTNGSDYYVIELQGKCNSKEEISDDSEQVGVGINEYVHYVSHNLSEDWALLPAVTRQQLETSRLIKYTFTGQMDKQPQTYPPFNGREKHLLKAQIIRITHSNYIVPRGLYKPNDDNR